jgi:hypothetical protein
LKIKKIRKFNLRENLKITRGTYGGELVLEYEARLDLSVNRCMVAAFENKVPLRGWCGSVCPI